MPAHRAATVRERPRRQRNRWSAHQPAESFLPRRGVAIAFEMTAVLPVPMVDWPANLFSQVHPMADDDWIDGELSVRDGPHAHGRGPLHDHAGAAS
jgi:hypothetical protein